MKQKIKKLNLFVMATLMMFTTIVTSFANQSDTEKLNNGDISIELRKHYDEEDNSVELTATIEALQTGLVIDAVTMDDGSELILGSNENTNEVSYTTIIKTNGVVKITVNYTMLSNPTTDVKKSSYTFEVSTDSIRDLLEHEEKNSEHPQPRTNISNNGVNISIPKYDGVGWENGTTKTVSIIADFDNVTSADKRLEITIPEGMRIETISANNKADLTGVDPRIVAYYDDEDPLYKAITAMTIPQKETAAMGATYGVITYDFSPGTKKVSINLTLSVDLSRYYGEHTIPNPIKANLSMNQDLNGVSGEVEQSITASGDPLIQPELLHVQTGTKQLLTSSPSLISSGKTHKHRVVLFNAAFPEEIQNIYARSVEYTSYVPLGTKHEGLGSSQDKLEKVSEDQSMGKVVYKNKNDWTSGFEVFTNYSLPIGLGSGTYQVQQQDSVTLTWYDGTQTTFTDIKPNYSVKVIEETANKLTIAQTNSISIDEDETYRTYGPTFQITNTQGALITNQTFEINIDPSYEVERVNIPFDSTIASNEITTLMYTTNTNATPRAYHGPTTKVDERLRSLSRSQLGLSDGEFITGISVKVGSFSSAYKSSNLPQKGPRIQAFGTLKSPSANVSIMLYDEENKNDTLVTETATISKSNTKRIASRSNGTINKNSITAGQGFKVETQLRLHDGEYTQVSAHALSNPEIYIREIAGLNLNINSLKITNKDGEVVSWEIDSKLNRLGERVYTIKTENTKIGGIFGLNNQETIEYLNVSYEMSTAVTSYGKYHINDFMSFGKQGYTPTSVYEYDARLNSFDINGSGNVLETLMFVSRDAVTVVENKNVLVETFLSLKGEPAKEAYVEGDDSTVAYFTPGTVADYTVKVTNNSDVPAQALDVYIPIPKTGTNFGNVFQKEAFKWDMTLTGNIQAPNGFRAEYSEDATAQNYNTSATYSTSIPSDLSKVTMVKLVAKNSLQPQEIVQVLVPLNVSETFKTASEGHKIGTRNVFNPVYDVESQNFSGQLTGTLVGTELSIAEVSGIVFEDKNADGLYKIADGDQLVKDFEVSLYKLDMISNEYEAVYHQGHAVRAITDVNGMYIFDYQVGLSSGTYAVKFGNPQESDYQFTINNPSNPLINSNVINKGPDRGMVFNINAIEEEASHINAGILRYTPPIDLGVHIDMPITKFSKDMSEVATGIITPAYFDQIKDSTNPYTWEIVGDASEKAKATLLNSNTASITVVPSQTLTQTTSFEIVLTIKDMYGNTKTSAPVRVTIFSTEQPSLQTENQNVYVEDEVNLSDAISAYDNEGNPIPIITMGPNKNTEISHAMPIKDGKYAQAGTYAVTITVVDQYGNKATNKSQVRVSGLPSIQASNQNYTLNDPEIDSKVADNASAVWLKASDTIGEKPTEISIGKDLSRASNQETLSHTVHGPSEDFSKVGVYKVVYTAINEDSRSARKEIFVTIMPIKYDVLKISASNFTISHDKAREMGQSIVLDKTYGNAKASFKRADDSMTDALDISHAIELDESQLNAIRNSDSNGGVFSLRLEIKHAGLVESTTIKITVKPVEKISPLPEVEEGKDHPQDKVSGQPSQVSNLPATGLAPTMRLILHGLVLIGFGVILMSRRKKI